MTEPKALVLPPKPLTALSARLPNRRGAQALQKYVIDVCDALARACRHQVGAVLPEPTVIADHFGLFTVEQARSFSVVLHKFYGASLPASRARS